MKKAQKLSSQKVVEEEPEQDQEQPEQNGEEEVEEEVEEKEQEDETNEGEPEAPVIPRKRAAEKAAVGEGATPAKRRKLSEETTSGSSEAPQQTEDQSKEDSCRIYVGNLSYNVDEAALVSQFESCGKVTKVQFITDKATGKFYGSQQAAHKALLFNGQKLLGRPLKTQIPAKPRGAATKGPVTPRAGCVTIFLGRLPYTVTDEEIHNSFGGFGEIRDIRWIQDANGDFKCCGFVEFGDENAAAMATSLNNTSLPGYPDNPIKVSMALRESRRNTPEF